MVRVVSFALAVAAGLCAALLVASSPTVHVDGRAESCPGIIVSAESVAGGPRGAVAAACDEKEHDWALLAGLAALLCLTCGSVAHFSASPDPDRPVELVSH